MIGLRLRGEGLEWREIDGEIVALETHGSVYLNVNRSGAFLWQALAAGATRESLVSGLAERFALDPERAEVDVDTFLASLRTRGLLEG